MQAVAGPNLEFLDITARFPGSYHDSRVLDNSSLPILFENKTVTGILLGDAGYPNRPYLFTPLQNPTTPGEVAYQKAHKSTRGVVERAFGVWKRRFPCLHRGLTNKIENVVPIILATAVLHNIAREQSELDDFPDDPFNEDDGNEAMPEVDPGDNARTGNHYRQSFIVRHFQWNTQVESNFCYKLFFLL